MTREARRRCRLGACVLIGAVAALGSLGVARGQVGLPSELLGIELVQWTSRSDTADFKRAFAKCPAGKMVLGGGGRVFMATPIGGGDTEDTFASSYVDDIGLSVSVPSQDLDGWAVTAQAVHPRLTDKNWFVSASAICAEATGLERVQQSTPSDATNVKRVFASCPQGSSAVGGGGRVFVPLPRLRQVLGDFFGSLPYHPIAIAVSAPSAALDGWEVNARTTRLLDDWTSWSASASAVCAQVSDVQFVEWSSRSDTTDFKRAFAKCPEGSTAIAGGGRVFVPPLDDGTQPPDDGIVLTVSVPSASLDGWAITAQAMRPSDRKATWFVTASAVCVQNVVR